ncbi:copper resistance protein CopC [Microbacterium sp. 179-B 1A2 NHS]|uniref:copper resistance CopC family protein n=1 Tax=Microbacterium sp. 179-B 1A2 NHS TaxID=3142383 RepID=UPI00399F023C
MPALKSSRTGSVLAALGLAALLLLPAAPAAAHDELVSSDPADEAVLGETPEQITLTFSNTPLTEPGSTEIAVFDQDCVSIAEGDPVVDGVQVTQAITGPVEGAVYVAWRVVSSDGHPISDELEFSVGDAGAQAAAEDCAEGTIQEAEGSTEGFNGTPYAVGAGVLFLGVGIVIAIAISRGRRGATKD